MITATLRKWGGSVALPIPKKLLSLASLAAGNEVTLDVQDGKIVIEASKPQFTLSQLMPGNKALKLPRDDEWLGFKELPSEQV